MKERIAQGEDPRVTEARQLMSQIRQREPGTDVIDRMMDGAWGEVVGQGALNTKENIDRALVAMLGDLRAWAKRYSR